MLRKQTALALLPRKWLIITCTGSRKTKAHGTSGKAWRKTLMRGVLMDWNLKKQRVWKLLRHMSSITVRSVLASPRAAIVAGGLDSLKTRWCGCAPSMSATSVDPQRVSWNTNPVGCKETGMRKKKRGRAKGKPRKIWASQ